MIKLGISLSHFNVDLYSGIINKIDERLVTSIEIFYAGSEDAFLFWEKVKNFSHKLFAIHCRKDLFFQSKEYIVEYFNQLLFLREKLPDTYFLFHPNGNIQLYLYFLKKIHLITLENTLPDEDYLLNLARMNDFQLVYDVAHANYFGGQYKLMNATRLAYIHLKGYQQNYSCLLKESDTSHLKILEQLGKDKTFILEYPYHSINEIYQDIFYITKYLKG